MATTAAEKTVWGIHAGRTGDADTLFLKRGVVALGWKALGDLSKIKRTRDGFKERIAHHYPNKKPGAIPNNAGQLYRFVHEMRPGDLVVYPSKRDRHVHVGEIAGEYAHAPEVNADYPNQRETRWLKEAPRTSFSQGALYEIGSALSLFQVKNYADEFVALVHGALPKVPPSEDETVAVVAAEIEETTRDFILKTLARELKGHRFADFVGHLLNLMGYRTRISPEGPDGGVDILAHKDELGFEPPLIKVQVKSGEGSVGDPAVSALYGKVDTNEYGLLVTLSSFTNPALNFAKSKTNLRLIDGEELVSLILGHYDDFDSTYKGILPLRRVYVPQQADEADDG
jgi:restriction system protein